MWIYRWNKHKAKQNWKKEGKFWIWHEKIQNRTISHFSPPSSLKSQYVPVWNFTLFRLRIGFKFEVLVVWFWFRILSRFRIVFCLWSTQKWLCIQLSLELFHGSGSKLFQPRLCFGYEFRFSSRNFALQFLLLLICFNFFYKFVARLLFIFITELSFIFHSELVNVFDILQLHTKCSVKRLNQVFSIFDLFWFLLGVLFTHGFGSWRFL